MSFDRALDPHSILASIVAHVSAHGDKSCIHMSRLLTTPYPSAVKALRDIAAAPNSKWSHPLERTTKSQRFEAFAELMAWALPLRRVARRRGPEVLKIDGACLPVKFKYQPSCTTNGASGATKQSLWRPAAVKRRIRPARASKQITHSGRLQLDISPGAETGPAGPCLPGQLAHGPPSEAFQGHEGEWEIFEM